MLVLSRKAGESIEIGTDITVRIVAVKGRTVKVAIDAPPQVQILRGELCADSTVRRRTRHPRPYGQEIIPAA